MGGLGLKCQVRVPACLLASCCGRQRSEVRVHRCTAVAQQVQRHLWQCCTVPSSAAARHLHQWLTLAAFATHSRRRHVGAIA